MQTQPIKFNTIEEATKYLIDNDLVGAINTTYESGYYKDVTGLDKGFYLLGAQNQPLQEEV